MPNTAKQEAIRKAYEWQGQPIKTEFGYCIVTENKDKPMYWYNYECNWDDYHNKERRSSGDKRAIIPAIKITYEDQVFCIANHFGIGVHKLINGGWPSHRHYSLPVDGFDSVIPKGEKIIFCLKQFDLEGFEAHESERKKWQKRTHPIEFEKSEAMRNFQPIVKPEKPIY